MVCLVDDFALTAAERRLFDALHRHGIRFLLLGLGAALLQGRTPPGRIGAGRPVVTIGQLPAEMQTRAWS